MRPRWQPVLACCSAFAALLPSAWLAGVPVRQWLVREAMEERILAGVSDDQLVHFAFTPAALGRLEWEREGREFRHGGRMFDVVRSRQEAGGTLHLWCVDDEEETRLVDGMERMAEQRDGPEDDPRLDRITVLQLIATPAPGGVRLGPLEDLPHELCRQAVGAVSDGALAIDPPPPRA